MAAASDVAPEPVTETLGQLRKKAVDGLYLDLRVGGWPKPVGVRYGMLPTFDQVQPLVTATLDASSAAEVHSANLGILLAACKGVFTEAEDGHLVSVDPAHPDVWPRFDDTLAQVLEMVGNPPARMVCEELFIQPLNLASHAGAVLQFWGMKDAEVFTKIAGESAGSQR